MKNLKFLGVLFSVLFSMQVFASLEWGDLDLSERYVLNQELNFEDKIHFHPGDTFDMLDRFGGDAPVIYMQFHSVKCENPDLTSEMILVNPNPSDTSRDRTIALQLEENCNVGLWVEVQDYYSSSIFDEFKSVKK